MSDFAGLWRLDGRPVDEVDLRRLAQGLEGRGIAPARLWRSGAVGMVHRQHVFTREDEAERMPLAGPAGGILVADLFLTDRAGLMDAPGLEPRGGRGRADGVLLQAALSRWGVEGALARLCGPFAFAWWEAGAERLVLARDPFGQRNLYLHRGERLIAFATRVRALLALPEVPRDLDDRALADTFILNRVRPERTVYRVIDRVPMGHVAVLGRNSTQTRPWWTAPVPGTSRFSGDAEVEEAAREVLDRAIGDFLRVRDPLTVFLTGGLDTAMVAATAARLSAPGRLTALTRIPDGGPIPAATGSHFYDESPRARALAGLYPNIDWRAVGEDGGNWGEDNPARWHLESGLPFWQPVNAAWFFPLFRAMEAGGSRVALGGFLGNSFFSHDGRTLLPALFRAGRWGELLRHLRPMAKAEGRPVLRSFVNHVLGPLEPLWLRQRRRGEPVQPWAKCYPLHPAFAAELRLDQTLDRRQYRVRCGGRTASVLVQRSWTYGTEQLSDSLGTVRAMSGIDWRGPLSDRRVAEFFGALPLDQFLRDGVPRSLARRLLAGLAPAETVTGRATGRQDGDWFARLSRQRAALRDDMARLRASPLARRVVDLDRLQRLLDHWPEDAEAAQRRQDEYWAVLRGGIHMAHFLAWHEGGNG